MSTAQDQSTRLDPKPLPANITSVQPGWGRVMRLEMAWGRLRRKFLRTFRPRYVAKMLALRQGNCPDCEHDIVDSRDLKFLSNVCGYRFEPTADRFRWRGSLGLARAGWAEILLISSLLIAAGSTLAIWEPWLALLPLPFLVFVVAFFRDPERPIPTGAGIVVSPADGKVDEIEEIAYYEPLDCPAVKVGIFLSVFNVHVNRAPESSRVIELQYFRGKFGNALDKNTARENEQLWILLEQTAAPHRAMMVKQIVGAIARRIVCEARPGQDFRRGERFGMIKFGSRTEIYLPKDGLNLEVQEGSRVYGGSSTIARY